MAIFKNTNKYFSAMDSRVIRNGLLSLPARGMLVTFLDRAETWQFRLSEIVRSLKLSPDEAKAILSELVEKGFAVERRDPYGVYYDIYAYPAQASGAPGRIPRRDGHCPSADPAEQTSADTTEKTSGMTDEQRAASVELIRKLFPPTKDYRSPYRD